jgi:nitroimidazol reductase NimA-like FMN-containing flavoprotein (pyridoxamine 5'-phosphate oxidase superfamily)
MRNDIKDLIQGNDVCVLATVSGRDPHCSLMSYAASDDCREIYMVTQKGTKKYRNLKENPSVSLLVDSRRTASRDRAKALTITGIMAGVEDAGRKEQLRTHLLARHPDLKEFFDQPDAEVLVVKVAALQLLDGLTDAYYEVVDE